MGSTCCGRTEHQQEKPVSVTDAGHMLVKAGAGTRSWPAQ